MRLEVRRARFPADAPAILAIDTSFTARQAYHVVSIGDDVRLSLRDLEPPAVKRYPLEELGEPAEAWVALIDGKVMGFAASSYEAESRRLVLSDIYVDPAARRLGVARALAAAAEARGVALGAQQLWAQTSTLNVPGVAAYRALGFHLSGFDLTLYDGTSSQGEIALLFSRPITPAKP